MNLLIIEDDKDILAFLESSLRREGFVVDTAGDGDAGCRKALGNDYDVVILDLALPHKGGREVCRELRQAGKQMPVLILSVKNEAETKVELFDMGADDYVVKPFSYSEILARIRVLLRRPRELRGDILRIADLTLDTRQRKLTCGTKDIHLTPKEFFLLEHLMRNRGSVLSRANLLEHVWDMNADPFTNTIETHILNLRKKIGKGTKREFIQSVSGTGYKID